MVMFRFYLSFGLDKKSCETPGWSAGFLMSLASLQMGTLLFVRKSSREEAGLGAWSFLGYVCATREGHRFSRAPYLPPLKTFREWGSSQAIPYHLKGSADFLFQGFRMVHRSLPCHLGGCWGFATLQCDVQDAARPCLPGARLCVDEAKQLLLLGLCLAHHPEPQPISAPKTLKTLYDYLWIPKVGPEFMFKSTGSFWLSCFSCFFLKVTQEVHSQVRSRVPNSCLFADSKGWS